MPPDLGVSVPALEHVGADSADRVLGVLDSLEELTLQIPGKQKQPFWLGYDFYESNPLNNGWWTQVLPCKRCPPKGPKYISAPLNFWSAC